MIARYDFFKTKYGEELLIDLIRFEQLEKYVMQTPVQRLSYYDITVISEGSGVFSIDGFQQDVGPGTVHFSSPGQVRQWKTPTMPKGYVMIFENEFISTFFNDAKFVESLSYFNTFGNLVLAPDDYRYIIGLLEDIERELPKTGISDKHMLRALLYQVLIFLNRKYIPIQKRPTNRYVDKFMDLVDALHQQHRSVQYYADKLHITVGHLNSLVKQQLNITAKEHILRRNMLEAKRLLQYTDLSIDAIASSLNYENTSYFVRFFRLHAHLTPADFRKLSNP